MIESIVLVHNFRTNYVGYSQIQTVFGPEYVRVENLQGYDRIAQYYFRPGEYDSDADGDDDNGGDGGDSDDNTGRVTRALLLLVVGRYSIQVSRMWRVFYLDYLYHDIPLVEENSHGLNDFPRQNIRFDSWTSKECFFYTSFRKNHLLRIYHQFGFAQFAGIYPCIYGI